jgi:uracil-DNA glycosylase
MAPPKAQAPLSWDPRKLGTKCAECPFAVAKAPNKPVKGEGPAKPTGVLVGEGPGSEEARAGRPFVGMTGQQLDIELAQNGLPRGKLFIVNATACQPPKGRDERMMAQAVKCCRPALLAQLKHLDPSTPVLAMGKWAYVGLEGRDRSILAARGFVREDWKIPR